MTSPFARLAQSQYSRDRGLRSAQQTPPAAAAVPAAADEADEGRAVSAEHDEGLDFNDVQAAADQLVRQQASDVPEAQPAEMTPVPTASAAQEGGEMPAGRLQIGVITGADVHALGQILGGTLGTIDEQDNFHLDPDYRALSYFFQLVGSKQMPLDQERGIARRQVPAALYPSIKATLIAVSGHKWASMYQRLGGDRGGLTQVAVEAEKEQVANGVKSYLERSGLAAYDVPVVVTATNVENSESTTMSQSDVAALVGGLGSVVIDPTREPQLHTERQEGASAQEGGVVNVPSGVLSLTFEGTMKVFARPAAPVDEVRQVAQICTEIIQSGGPNLSDLLKAELQTLQHIEVTGEIAQDADDEGDYDRYR